MLIAIKELFSYEKWPAEYLPVGTSLDESLANVYFTDYQTLVSDRGIGFEARIVSLETLVLPVPGLGETALVFGVPTPEGAASFHLQAYAGEDGFILLADNIAFALRFPPDILRPVPPADGTATPPYAQITVRGAVWMDHSFDFHFEGFDAISLPPSMIGSSGITISADDVRLDLSRTTTIPEVIAAGFDESFVGVFIGEARIGLPEGLSVLMPESLVLRNAAIGTGGVSGVVEANFSPLYDEPTRTYSGTGAGTLFGIPFGLRRVALEFKENAIISSDIHGELVLPFFDHPVALDLGIGLDGSFSAALSAVQPEGVTTTGDGLIELERPGLLRLRIDSLAFEKNGADALLTLSGTVQLLYGGLDWPEVDVRALSIDKDGHIRIEGGWLELPDSKVLDFNGFTMELTRIGFGNSSDRKWIGFSGGIRLVDEMAFGASVEGLKVLWDAAGNTDLQMSSIRVELTVPDAFAFEGFVEFFQEGESKGFRGDIDLILFPLDTAFEAGLLVGKNEQSPPYNFFYIFINAELPAGIPLGQTNLAIYGFAALLGHNVRPRRDEDQEWFEWYRADPIGTTDTDKWIDGRGSQALGAGITLGTAADDGFSFSAKTLFVLLLPGPLLLIDGKGSILKKRKELAETQGDYRTLAILDRRAETILINLQPRFKYDQVQAAVIDVLGAAEGFFDFNHPDAWHLYLGQNEPRDKRIRAKILKGLFNADAYLMLDENGTRLGGSAGFDKEYKYGPLRVALQAEVDAQAEMSWSPLQANGTIRFEGLAGLRALGCRSSVSVNATLEVEAPQPYYVNGSFRVRLRTPWPLRDPSARVRLQWGDQDEEPDGEDTIAAAAAEHLKVADTWDLAIHLHHHEQNHTPPAPYKPNQVPAGLQTIPLDSKVLLAFNRPVADRALVGCNTPAPPLAERSGSWESLHELTGIVLERAEDNQWTPVEERIGGTGDLFGMWLPLPAGSKASGKLQLWSGSPFAYGRNSGRSYFDAFLDRNPSYPCVSAEPAEETVLNFERARQGARPALFVEGDLIFERLFAHASMQAQIVYRPSVAGGTKQALLGPDPDPRRAPLRITFPQAVAQARLLVSCDRAVTARAFGNGVELANKDAAAGVDVELALDATAIDAVEIALSPSSAGGNIWISRVGYTMQSDRDRAADVDRVRLQLTNELSADTARWCGQGHLLQPDSLYRLTIATQLRRWRDGQEQPLTLTDNYVYLRTTPGPPGFFETKGRLRDLVPYVNETASTPRNGQQPVYRGYDVRLIFNENYVRTMYAAHDLAIRVQDRNGVPATDEESRSVTVTNEWSTEPATEGKREDRLWLWSLQRPKPPEADCHAGADIAECVAPNDSLEARLPDRPLAPLTLIEAHVSAIAREEPLHRITFITSRFVTFLHHIHSFENVVWDHHELMNEPTGSLMTSDAMETAKDLVAAHQNSGGGFDAIASLFKLGHRRLPVRLELTLLRDEARSYALLLEGPEPIDWVRTTAVLQHRAGTGRAFASPRGTVRIVGVALRSPDTSATAYNVEWIDLLVGRDSDLGGFMVEYRGDDAAGDSFARYYSFAEEARLPAGTAVRIHAGAAASDGSPAPEFLHRYSTGENETEMWRLNPAGDTIRLLNRQGTELHRWDAIPASEFGEIPFVLIRSTDQTRAFVIFAGTDGTIGNVPAGRMRMNWRYRRDVGSAGPILKRHGSSEAEEAVIEFAVPEL